MAYENEKAEREFRMNPPSAAPGQGDDDDWGDLSVGSSSVESMPDTLITGNNGANNTVVNQDAKTDTKSEIDNYTSTEDKVVEVALKASKGIWYYFKALGNSFRNNSSTDWHNLGVRISAISVSAFLISWVFVVVKIFSKSNNQPFDLTIGSICSAIVGIGLCMTFDKEDKVEPEEPPEPIEEEIDLEEYAFDFSDESEYTYTEPSEDEPEEDIWGALMEGGLIDDNLNISIESDDFSVKEALEKIEPIPYGTQTRRYLFETFCSILPKMSPTFADMRLVSDESEDFYYFEGMIRSAAFQVGTKEESLPELESVYVNDFIYRLNCNRPVGIKEQLIADEVASTYSRDDNNMEFRIGVYANTETSTGKFTINLFKGELKENEGKSSIKISLGDIYKKLESFVADPKNVMPFIWGVSEFGKPIYCDILDVNSFIYSGEPRGGKSWKGQSMLAQLCMFNSPKEIEFYIFDGKNLQSDYRYASAVLPHIKYFCGDPNRINDGIEKVLNKAVTERQIIFNNTGCINIKDYNTKYPNDKLPYMYIVVDELMSLMEHFKINDMKEEASRFKGFLSIMVSKLANMGVRFILFPHRIVESVISKNTYSLISTRAVVNQSNPDDLKSALDVTSKTFPYKLVSPGDMAIRSKDIERGKVIFCHAEMLSTSNENNQRLFEFIGSVWTRLEPDCKCLGASTGTVCGKIEIKGIEKKVSESYSVEDIDNTNGAQEYEYKGYDNQSSTEDILKEFDGEDSNVDESFWSEF